MAWLAVLFADARTTPKPVTPLEQFNKWLQEQGVSRQSPAVVIVDPVATRATERVAAISTLCWSAGELRGGAQDFRAGVTVDLETRELCSAAGAIILIYGEVPMMDQLTFAEGVRILRYE